MKNYISINISYLIHKSRLSQDEFGQLFELNKGLIGKYVNEISLPKIETIQNICTYFQITIDDFINSDLSSKPYGIYKGELLYGNEPPPQPNVISPKYVELLEKAIIDKDKLITVLEDALKEKERDENLNDSKKNRSSA